MFGRRDTVEKLEETPDLDPIDSVETIDSLVEAVRDVSIEGVISPYTRPIETLQSVYSQLDDEDARRAYLADGTLLRRINAARRQFNKWKGRKLRSKEIPTWVEAGPANYDTEKAQRKSQYARDSSEELDRKMDKVRAAANGARQRALESVGSSVSEANAKKATSKRETMRNQLESGMIVKFRNPTLTIGKVVRVNKKTVTTKYEQGLTKDPRTGEELDPMAKTRVDLDSEWLTIIDAETIEEAENQQEDE